MNPGGRVREIALRGLVAAALVLAVAALDRFEVVRIAAFQLGRNDTPRPLLNACLYAVTYLIGAFGIAALLCHRPLVRGASALLVLALACVQVGFAAVNGTGFTHHEAALLFTDAAFFATDALRFFVPRFALPVLGTLAIGGATVWLAARRGPRLRSWLWLAVPIAALVAGRDLVERTFGKVYQFPVPIRVPLLIAWGYEHRLPHYAEREPVSVAPAQPPLTDHIVLVVDESVNGHSLGINGGPAGTTPWLSSAPPGVFNYGITAAISNLSSSSNLLLQAGLPISAFPDRDLRALRVPNVFSYLSAAGFRTAFIDSQSYSDQPPNLMTGFDLARIDVVLKLREQHRGAAERDLDFLALPDLRALIEGNAHTFTYLLKTGAHLPYADKSPRDHQPFQPVLDTWVMAGGDPTHTRNSYWNALRWTVDEFLHELSNQLAATGREILVIYTSDHGQWLPGDPDGGRPVTPHATPVDPPMQQGSVPLLLLAFGPHTRAAVAQRFDPQLVDRASDFAIFPTVLQAAGYAVSDTRPQYSASLFERDAVRPPSAFLSGNVFARDGDYYVLNPALGSACFTNPFSPEAVRASLSR